MNQSLFSKYVARFFSKLQLLIETVNGKRNKTLTYLHKEYLNTEYAPDNKWESTSVNTTYVSADYVSVDSELPIKNRDSVGTANGKLPKVGMMKVLKESDINTLNVMEVQGGNTAKIKSRWANDSVACAVGIDEKNEDAFLFGLSNGYIALTDEDNPDVLMRLNFNYIPENSFGVAAKGVITLDDIERVKAAADANGDTIIHAWISKTDYDALRHTQGAKELAATYDGRNFDADTKLPVPVSSKFNEAFADEYGFDFIVVDRTVKYESNGKRYSRKPWARGRVVFVCNDVVGTLVYGRLAEETNPVKHVNYQKVDLFKLISKYSLTNPLREVTAGQAFVAPIIEDVDQIYTLDANNAEEVDTAAEATDATDVKVTYKGKAYDKEKFVKALNTLTGGKLTNKAKDETILAKVNELSDADQAIFDESIKGL